MGLPPGYYRGDEEILPHNPVRKLTSPSMA